MQKLSDLLVHPAANIFPMMADDELAELAADIAENGLQNPIMVGEYEGAPCLIDGRNRLAACRIAKVQPTSAQLNGADPIAYIISANINRRHMTKGQRAMAVAMIHPEPAKGGRGKKGPIESAGFSRDYLLKARTVLKVLPELGKSVLGGSVTLSEAYDEAMRVRKEQSSTETRMQEVRSSAPDLSELVDAGKLSTMDALAAHHERKRVTEEKERQQRDSVCQAVRDAIRAMDTIAVTKVDLEQLFDAERDRADFERWFGSDIAVPSDEQWRVFTKFANQLRSKFN